MYVDILNKNSLSTEDVLGLKIKNDFSEKLKELDTDEIIKKTVYLDKERVIFMFNLIEKVYGNIFKGNVLELGSGSGFLTANLSKNNQINSVSSLEIVEGYVKNIQPKIVEKYGHGEKIKYYVGSFNDLKEINNNEFDLVFEYDSFHHSSDIQKTFNESFKKLKKGGRIICIDRIQPDRMSDEIKENKLNIRYNDEFFKKHGIEKIENLSRRDNGEHEFRENEWIGFAKKAGFENISVTKFQRNTLKNSIKSIFSYLPYNLIKSTNLKYYSGQPINKIFSSFFNNKPSPNNKNEYIGCINKSQFHKSIHVLYGEK